MHAEMEAFINSNVRYVLDSSRNMAFPDSSIFLLNWDIAAENRRTCVGIWRRIQRLAQAQKSPLPFPK